MILHFSERTDMNTKKSQHSVISAREVEMEESSKIHVRTEKGDILWGSELKFLRVDAF